MKRRYVFLKYAAFAAVPALLFYFSCSLEPLDEALREKEEKEFHPEEHAREFWDKLAKNMDRAVDAVALLGVLERNVIEARALFHAKTHGIASNRYYFLTGRGKVVSVEEDGVLVSIRDPESTADVLLATAHIYQNEVTIASGLLNVNEFSSTMQFNNISVAVNKIITSEIAPPFREKVTAGAAVRFVGAAKVSEDEPKLHPLRVIPVSLEVE